MGTRIVAVKLKEIIKKAVYAVLGIAVIGMLIYLFMPEDDDLALYNAGTYSSDIVLHNQPVSVEVTVSNDEILDIRLINMDETQAVFYPLFEPTANELAEAIIEKQSTDIECDADKTTTANILLAAVNRALENAKK